MMEYKVNDYKEAKDWLKNTAAVIGVNTPRIRQSAPYF